MPAKPSKNLGVQKAKLEPFYEFKRPVKHVVMDLSKGPTLSIDRKNATFNDDENTRITKIDWSKGADEPMTDLQRQGGRLKMFKQAELMTEEKMGFKHNPVVQDCDEAFARFTGQEKQ